MTHNPPRKIGQRALLISPVLIAVGGFIAVLHWVRPQNTTFVLALTAAVSIFVMGYTVFLARRAQGRLDEVQIAHHQYASSQGRVWGLGIAILLLMTPVSGWLIDLANMLTTGSPDTSNRGSVQIALYFGLMVVAVVETVCIVVAAVIWQRRMGLREG